MKRAAEITAALLIAPISNSERNGVDLQPKKTEEAELGGDPADRLLPRHQAGDERRAGVPLPPAHARVRAAASAR